jgi:hypothetical protein
MNDDSRFLRETVVDVDAAVVGISSVRWTAILETDAKPDNAIPMMKTNRFDILPIVAAAGVKEYFCTDRWNDYSSVSKKTITHRDVIPFDTRLRDVIRGFASDSRSFYFLSNNRRIVGLITVVNLNCRAVKVYLFSLLAELEIQLGRLIARHISDPDLLQETFAASTKPKHEAVKQRYKDDRARGIELPVVEYLYLSDLINVIASKKLFPHLGYKSRGRFEDRFNVLSDFRDAVAHPSRSLITDQGSCKKLWERIDGVEEALFVLGEA